MTSINVLELYSGIGGMHYALKASELSSEVVEAADINTVANLVYSNNFPKTKIQHKNILSLSEAVIDSLQVDIILMSPPCQPYTRLGKKEDTSDRRSDSLSHLVNIIPKVSKRLKYILLENVKGFENSDSRNNLINSLKPIFNILEFLLNPLQFGIPNSRERYYLLARRDPFTIPQLPVGMITDPSIFCTAGEDIFSIKNALEISDDSEVYKDYLIPENVLFKRAQIMDIVTKDSKKTCCFTKAYGRYIEGTGSVYCPFDDVTLKEIFQKVKSTDNDCGRQELLKSLRLRFFSPREVSNLMCFPEEFKFPPGVTDRQKYNLLGNSINVKVVSKLITFLTS